MTPRQQLTLLRIIRLLSWIGGIAIIASSIPSRHGSVSFSEALPLLIGVAVIFLPYAITCMVVPACCPACGEKTFVDVRHDVASHSHAGTEQGPVHSFCWKCRSCGELTQIRSTWFDRLLTPRFSSTSGTNATSDPGE